MLHSAKYIWMSLIYSEMVRYPTDRLPTSHTDFSLHRLNQEKVQLFKHILSDSAGSNTKAWSLVLTIVLLVARICYLKHVVHSPSSIIWYWSQGSEWCCTVGKVAVGLASHWSCVTDSSGLSIYGSRHKKGFERPANTSLWGTYRL